MERSPQEVARTRSFHYSNFNLAALLRWAMIAEKLGINLYKYKGPQGQTLFTAVDAIIPAAVNGQKDWPFEELEFFGTLQQTMYMPRRMQDMHLHRK